MMIYKKRNLFIILLLAIVLACVPTLSYRKSVEKIGVLFVIHGGTDTNKPQYMWDCAVHQFSFDHNHPVHNFVIWNPKNWPLVLDTNVSEFTLKFFRMYEFEFKRIGGKDSYHSLSEQQLTDMKAELDKRGQNYDLEFEVDWAGFQPGDRVQHYPYPRFIYYGPDGPGVGDNCTYCGEGEPGGPWTDCDPKRYNVDGPVERLLKKRVSRIIIVDLLVSGMRYSKTYNVVQMAKRALDDWNNSHGTAIPIFWINDYSNLMERSYPKEPAGWTSSLGLPTVDRHVLLNGSPNPIVSDPELATLHVKAIEAGMSATVSDADTGVLILSHAIYPDNNEVFDPKINDTLILHKNMKSRFLSRHPTTNPDNIIGAFLGKKEKNPENGLEEHTRKMRGELYGDAWLYESDKELPGAEWGYRCWDALEYLKDRGVKHIVVSHTQICTSSVLDLVELPNQIGRDIGIKTWAKWGTWDYKNYPGVGHPFADYWGIWAYTDCGEWQLNYHNGTSKFSWGATLTGQTSRATGVIKWSTESVTAGTLTLKEVSGTFQAGEFITDNMGGGARADGSPVVTSKTECCFEMGGCGDPLRPYPPPRQALLNQARNNLDPSLVYDVSDYGHLGFDPAIGSPDSNNPTQAQYTGTWAMYVPPNDDPHVGRLLAKHVLNAAVNPMVYITNGEIKGIKAGESVTFEAHVTGGGMSPYTYEWFIKKEGTAKWLSMGANSLTYTWNPAGRDAGIYSIQCKVTDAQDHIGEVVWKDFVVSQISQTDAEKDSS